MHKCACYPHTFAAFDGRPCVPGMRLLLWRRSPNADIKTTRNAHCKTTCLLASSQLTSNSLSACLDSHLLASWNDICSRNCILESRYNSMTIHISLQEPSSEHRHLLSTLSTHVSKSKRTVIVTGAGISCNAGIPVIVLLPYWIDIRIFGLKTDYTISSKRSIPKQ